MDNEGFGALLLLGGASALWIAFCLALFALKIYGAVVAFKKKWYFGLMALVVPFFGEIVGVAKLVFKKDILE